MTGSTRRRLGLAFAGALGAAALTMIACSSSDDGATPGLLDGGAPESTTPPDPGDSQVPEDGGGADAPPTVDPCAAQKAVCPTTTTTEGSGLVPIDRCAFPLVESSSFATYSPIIKALGALAPAATTAAVLADLNRTAVPTTTIPGGPAGVSLGFTWDADDQDVATWIPQGLTGSADATATGLLAGRRVVLVSWYYTPPAGSTYEKGVRLALVDVTVPQTPTYRLLLLVEPTGTPAAPSFAPVVMHAGGLAWVGDFLYVVETGRGFRVFDMSRMLQAATDVDVIGCTTTACHAGLYKYVVPQIGAYGSTSECKPLFSYVSLDKSTTPPSLVSGEYCGGTACASNPLAGRVFRWPLDGITGRLASGTSWPSEAFLMGEPQVQGAASRKGVFYLSSSAPAGGGGALYRVTAGKRVTSTWLDAPEDLMVDESNGLLWGLAEAAGARAVAGMKLTSYPAPP
jgi:hypothetical protein